MRAHGGGADGERHCPPRRPELASTVPVPDAWHESYLPPAVGGGLLLAAAGAAGDAEAGTVPALVALDARSAVERFRVRVPLGWRGAEGCQVGVPRPLPDARILLPVYQWDESFTVYLIDADGRILRADDLADGREPALDVYGADVSVKLWQEPLAVGTGAYLASWVYRACSWHLQCRDLATGALRWEAAERALAAAGDLAVTETAPGQDDGGAIVGRAIADGRERWRLPPCQIFPRRARSFGAVVGDTVVLVDRGRRLAAEAAREEAIVARAAESDVEPDLDEPARAWERRHPAPGEELIGYDLAGGRERWCYPVGGEVVAIAEGPAMVCAVVVDGERRYRLERILVDGPRARRSAPVDIDLGGGGDVARRDPPVIAYVDATHLLLASPAELVCVSTAAPETVVWRLPLPDSPPAPRPNPGDRRMLGASIAVAHGRVWVRGTDSAWMFVEAAAGS
ncbi:hypothetical protein ACQP2P_14780 [Dactylosporangium sp. CA-139114]|uniref:hypothetical protein n=1 Tax=Dactylosporangium sp. CA-139114 TaxID=3239931 RepID=UPI003D97514B